MPIYGGSPLSSTQYVVINSISDFFSYFSYFSIFFARCQLGLAFVPAL